MEAELEKAVCRRCKREYNRFVGPWQPNGLCPNCTYADDSLVCDHEGCEDRDLIIICHTHLNTDYPPVDEA